MILDEIRERPILFSGAMIEAIFAGRKTQTRRVVTPQPTIDKVCWESENWIWVSKKLDAGYCHTQREPMQRLMAGVCPYGKPGDTLWVREAFARTRVLGRPITVFRAADTRTDYGGPWKPGIHMPRDVCRLRLHVKAVRAERLHDITEVDADAEGCGPAQFDPHARPAIAKYRALWDSLNAARGFRWLDNPFVYVVEFVRL
jgi:hypothetical protein